MRTRTSDAFVQLTTLDHPGDAALFYAELGWAVIPLHSIRDGRCTCGRSTCHSPGKHPRTAHGVHDATTDLDQIAAWWMEWPDANVGIVLGRVSGLVVIDVDERAGGLTALADLAGLIPETLSARTGAGMHWYFRTPEYPVRTRQLAPGIELRGEGSYVVAPPSRHASGQHYTWLSTAVLAELPQELAAPARATTGNGRTAIEPGGHWVAEALVTPIGEGQRNIQLTRIAGYLRNVLPFPITLELMRQWNARCCQPPLPASELERTVRGLYERYTPPIALEPEAWTAQSLLRQEFPRPREVVEGLLPEGLALLGGRPKRGKSWLALQIAVDVVSGRHSLGRTETGRVLVLALEDSPRRLQARLRALNCPETSDLHLYTAFPPLYGGGVGELLDLIDRIDPVLVIIDTLSRAFVGLKEQDRQEQMTAALAPLQQLALAKRLAVLLIDHHRKPGPDMADMIDDIIGSTAKVGVADTVLGLYRKTGENLATLRVTGRDIEEREVELHWDALRLHWIVTGDATETAYQRHRQRVLAYLGEVVEADRVAISRHLDLAERQTRDVLQRMIEERVVQVRYEQGRRGRPTPLYRLAPLSSPREGH